jgi:hypothetical protein
LQALLHSRASPASDVAKASSAAGGHRCGPQCLWAPWAPRPTTPL